MQALPSPLAAGATTAPPGNEPTRYPFAPSCRGDDASYIVSFLLRPGTGGDQDHRPPATVPGRPSPRYWGRPGSTSLSVTGRSQRELGQDLLLARGTIEDQVWVLALVEAVHELGQRRTRCKRGTQ